MHEPGPVRRRQRCVSVAIAGLAGRLAVLTLAIGQHQPVAAVGRAPDDLEPAIGVGHVPEGAVTPPAGRGVVAVLAGHDLDGAGRDLDERDLVRLEVVDPPLPADRQMRAGWRPGHRVDIGPGRGQRDGGRKLRGASGTAAARHRGVDDPDLRPAASARQEGEPLAVGRPARVLPAPGLGHGAGQPGAVRLDHPDLVLADERQPPPIGRPLRVTDRMLRRGDLDGRGAEAAQREREELAAAGRLVGEGDDAVARMEPELAGRLDRDDRLDRDAGSTARIGDLRFGHPGALGPSATSTHHGPTIARCLRTWPWRQSYAHDQPSGERSSSSVRPAMASSNVARDAS